MKKLLRKRYISSTISKLKKQQKQKQPAYKNYDEIKNVLLLADAADVSVYEHIKSIKNTFEKDGKKVGIVLFVWDKTTSDFFAKSSTVKVITEDSFKWNAAPDADVLQYISGYDLLVNLNHATSDYIDYLTLLADAKLKAGTAQNDTALLDFMVETGETFDLQFLAEQIIFYLRTIKSKRQKDQHGKG